MFEWPVRVYYEDTDAGGIVYHARYLYFLERCRTEWLRQIGFDQSVLKRDHLVFVIRDMAIKWHVPATLDDELNVKISVIKVKGASIMMEQSIVRQSNNKNVTLVTATVTIACLNTESMKPMAIPSEISNAMLQNKNLDEGA